MTRHPRPRPLERRPSVTVVVPCHNYGHYLPIALGSVLTQPGVGIEVIVIDDASTDGSAAVVRALADADDRVTAILHARNAGHIATYNEGLERATGDYVVLLSADDALTPGSLERAVALLEAEPSVGFVYGFPREFTGALPPAEMSVRSWTVWDGRDWIARRCRTGANCIMNPEVVMRTAVQHAIGGYDARLPHSGDLEMWMRAAAIADVGRVNGPEQGYYRVHAASMQRTIYAGHLIDLEGRLDAFRAVLVGPGARVRGGEELFATARRALARTALDYARAAHDFGRAGVEPIAGYLAFAERTWPPVRASWRWRAVARRARGAERPALRALRSAHGRVATDLRWRLRWRRWRWSGV